MFVYVGGIPGVGKTTIVKKVSEIANGNGFPIQIMEEKKVLCEITGVKSVTKYHFLPEAIRSKARRQMVVYFYNLDRKDPETIRIRDDHFSYLRQDGTYFIRPFEKRDKIQMLAVVVVIVDPQTILKRRLDDKLFRLRRELVNRDVIVYHQETEIETASSQARQLGIPIGVFENKRGKIIRTSRSIFSFIQKVATAKKTDL